MTSAQDAEGRQFIFHAVDAAGSVVQYRMMPITSGASGQQHALTRAPVVTACGHVAMTSASRADGDRFYPCHVTGCCHPGDSWAVGPWHDPPPNGATGRDMRPSGCSWETHRSTWDGLGRDGTGHLQRARLTSEPPDYRCGGGRLLLDQHNGSPAMCWDLCVPGAWTCDLCTSMGQVLTIACSWGCKSVLRIMWIMGGCFWGEK